MFKFGDAMVFGLGKKQSLMEMIQTADKRLGDMRDKIQNEVAGGYVPVETGEATRVMLAKEQPAGIAWTEYEMAGKKVRMKDFGVTKPDDPTYSNFKWKIGAAEQKKR